jgi:S-adenosylmethionine hydrolase
MRTPIVTLTTDFGLADHYVGVMKGVILGICPGAQLVDISHEVRPYAISEGAFLIAQAYGYFPPETVHLVVVDPGVGSPRRPIVVEAADQYFVGPDNGVFGLLFAREKHRVRLIQNRELIRPLVSNTFHGRDIFAPVAGHLAAGVAPSQIGDLLDSYIRPAFENPRRHGDDWIGEILKIDHFGNIVTNFRAQDFLSIAMLTIGESQVNRMVRSYAEAGPGELVAIAGSSGYLEVSFNQRSAAEQIGCRVGDPCRLRV